MPTDYSKMSAEDAHFAKMRDDQERYIVLNKAVERATDIVLELATQSVNDSRPFSNQSDADTAFGGTPVSTVAFSRAVSERFKYHASRLRDLSRSTGYQQVTNLEAYGYAFDVSKVAWQATADGSVFTIGAGVEAKDWYPVPDEPEHKTPKADSSLL